MIESSWRKRASIDARSRGLSGTQFFKVYVIPARHEDNEAGEFAFGHPG